MDKQEIYKNMKVGDLVLLDPETVRSEWGKKWANNKWAVEIISMSGSRITQETTITGTCSEDKDLGPKRFDANRILSFADELSQIKRDSQRL